MARQFAASGHELALVARRVERLEELRDSLPGARVLVHSLDVDDHDAVFQVVRELDERIGGLDRIIVNAGVGKGAPLGTGRFAANRQTVTTNLVSALAQCEAAMELFRPRNRGHLVVVSSISALRGMPRNLTAYAASKAGVAALAEGIRAEMIGTPIKVTTLYPGYIRSEMNDQVAKPPPMIASTADGVRAMVRAIEQEAAEAIVPRWPWRPLATVIRHAPLRVIRRFA
jgi:short-subunit dehydrogenase